MTPQQAARAARLYRAGQTLREIAAKMDTDSKAVWRAIAGRTETRRTGPRGRTDITDTQVIELRDDLELSWQEIADKVGMSRTGVRARYQMATTGQRWR